MAEVKVERYGNDLGLCSLLRDPWPQEALRQQAAKLLLSVSDKNIPYRS